MSDSAQEAVRGGAMVWPLRLAVIIGLMVLLPATVSFGIAAFLGKPERPPYPHTEIRGTDDKTDAGKEVRKRITDAHSAAMQVYDQGLKRFDRSAFWVSLPVGLLLMGIGFFRGLGDIGTGLLASGVVLTGISHLQYESGIGNGGHFAGLLAGSVLLVLVGWRRLYLKR